MAIYPVLISDERTTVIDFLSQGTLRPRIRNPRARVPQLVEREGIVHYTRSGERYVITMADEEIDRGDFLAVADSLPSGEGEQAVVANPESRDYAFVIPRDDFGTGAEHYMNRRPSTAVITACRSLDSVLRALCYPDAGSRSLARHIATPINSIVIVSHAGAAGALFCRLRDDSPDAQIFLDHLCPYVHDRDRPVVTSGIMQNTSDINIYIRGCNVGQEPRFLRFIKDIFGDEVTVTAPLHEDRFGHLRDGSTFYRFEYMRQCFKIARREQVSDKAELVSLFQGLNATNIHGTQITSEQWNSWIPDNIHPGAPGKITNNYPCTISFHRSARVERFYRYRYRSFYRVTISWEDASDIPAGQSEREAEVQQELSGAPDMQDDYPSSRCQFPVYQRWGFESVDGFVNGLRWVFSVSGNTLTGRGGLYEYDVRIPITDTGNNLLVNAFLGTGDREYLPDCHDIVETDTSLFATV